jgi:hypothetical protein
LLGQSSLGCTAVAIETGSWPMSSGQGLLLFGRRRWHCSCWVSFFWTAGVLGSGHGLRDTISWLTSHRGLPVAWVRVATQVFFAWTVSNQTTFPDWFGDDQWKVFPESVWAQGSSNSGGL